MRLNRYISSSGVCSRRKAEEFIAEGRVRVNGEVADITTAVNQGDEVTLDGKPVSPKKEHVVLLFNKPIGITCTTETHV